MPLTRSRRAKGGSVIDRAVALAHQAAREKEPVAALAAGGGARPGFATGGGGHRGPNPMLAAQLSDGNDTQIDGGLVNSPGPGRTDVHNASVPAGSYVLPADVISGLGEGNTLAGSKIVDRMLSTGPYGIAMPRMPHGGSGIPNPPAPYQPPAPVNLMSYMGTSGSSGTSGLGSHYAAGGGAPHADRRWIPIAIAGGEYVVSPDQVSMIGAGDLSRGLKILDEFVKHIRKRTVKTLRSLPGPVK